MFDKVCQHLTITNNEKDYFACSFKDDKKIRVSVSDSSVVVVVVAVVVSQKYLSKFFCGRWNKLEF